VGSMPAEQGLLLAWPDQDHRVTGPAGLWIFHLAERVKVESVDCQSHGRLVRRFVCKPHGKYFAATKRHARKPSHDRRRTRLILGPLMRRRKYLHGKRAVGGRRYA